MIHEDRRKELGRMLMDVGKYLATVGLIGGILTDKLTLMTGFAIATMVLILILVAFYIIPPMKGV
ncbi:MAG: hypothetical protein IIB44_12545 [Candidatus Marinimicrobia bacterium]|nr:hypothetical protein [Candidatus Neomarinimicrobiota bacterium]MCH8069632.1 hypothetical protein [Candidatus Neomarinimicrobiota bacterium]